MKHLSIRTTELPRTAVARFSCPYKMGDDFVSDISSVDCKFCLTQIQSAHKESSGGS